VDEQLQRETNTALHASISQLKTGRMPSLHKHLEDEKATTVHLTEKFRGGLKGGDKRDRKRIHESKNCK
jgi:hypothetical protein